MSRIRSTQCGVRWTTRIVPVLIAAIVGYATYVVCKRVCVDYLYHEQDDVGLLLTFLILYFLFFILSATSYIRTIWVVKTDPAAVPLLPDSRGAKIEANRRNKRSKVEDIEAQLGWRPADNNPDSPGLEQFYRKNAFICEGDGRPRWCHDCGQWKPDRASHSREIGRCVRKMDHYCPWTGGMVSESSFKFFTQFVFYCTLFCGIVLAACAYTVAHQAQDSLRLDPHILATLVLGAFFGLFCFSMSLTAFRFVFKNQTNVDMLKKQVTYQIAVNVPLGTLSTANFSTVTYPLPEHGPPSNKEGNGTARGPGESTWSRDQLAKRTFAILKTEPGENPWDLGYWKNWQQVMGNNVFDYLFPVSRSPCTNHESEESDYPFGFLDELAARHGLTSQAREVEGQDGIEMQTKKRHRDRQRLDH